MAGGANGNGDNWIVGGLRGVNILTLILLILGGASLYWQLDKDIALMKRDIQDIEKQLMRIERLVANGSQPPYASPRSRGDQGKS